MNAFIQDYDGKIGIYSSTTKALIKDGFASVEEARNWTSADGHWDIIWVATTEIVKAPVIKTQAEIDAEWNIWIWTTPCRFGSR